MKTPAQTLAQGPWRCMRDLDGLDLAVRAGQRDDDGGVLVGFRHGIFGEMANIGNRARLELWVSITALIVGLRVWWSSERSPVALAGIVAAYVATYVAVRAWRLRTR